MMGDMGWEGRIEGANKERSGKTKGTKEGNNTVIKVVI
jgi:hypothetical protein